MRPDRLGFRTVASADGPSDLRFATELGRWFPGAGGASGHVLFAHHPDPDIADRLLADQPGATRLDAVTLRSRHADARKDGYSISHGEFDPRVLAVAAPVVLDGGVVASLCAVGPRRRSTARSTTCSSWSGGPPSNSAPP